MTQAKRVTVLVGWLVGLMAPGAGATQVGGQSMADAERWSAADVGPWPARIAPHAVPAMPDTPPVPRALGAALLALDVTPTAANPWRPLHIAKWSVLGLTAAAAGYGLWAHHGADARHETIDRICERNADRCAERGPDGGYTDPELQTLEREAARLDDRTRIALVASQLGAAASVLLFMLDLRPGVTPPNIPYEPPGWRVGARPDGGMEVEVRVPL